jgi:hypothetical protein
MPFWLIILPISLIDFSCPILHSKSMPHSINQPPSIVAIILFHKLFTNIFPVDHRRNFRNFWRTKNPRFHRYDILLNSSNTPWLHRCLLSCSFPDSLALLIMCTRCEERAGPSFISLPGLDLHANTSFFEETSGLFITRVVNGLVHGFYLLRCCTVVF